MSYNSAEINEFSDIWVFCEQREGKLMNTDFELISEGRKLADERGSKLVGILLGGEGIENSAKELGGYGADKVIVCADRRIQQGPVRCGYGKETGSPPDRRIQHWP